MTAAPIRVGIIGAGAIANSHVEGLRAAGCAVVAIADPAETPRTRAAEAHKITAYASLTEMRAAEKLDAVSVCVPNSLHAPLAIEALGAGLAVLCEKPPATSLAAAVDMRKAARKSGKLLMMGFNQRFEPHAQQLARMREKGVFGDIYHAKAAWIRRRGIPGMGGWFTTKAMAGGGPVYDIGIHILDRTWFIMGRPKPVSVSAMAYAKFGNIDTYVCEGMWAGPRRKGGTCDTEDFAAAFIRFDNGASMQFEVSWAGNRPDENGRTLVMGDKAGASWEGDTVQIYGESDNAITTSSIAYDKTIYDNRFVHFAKCLRGEAVCSCTADDGVSVQAMLDAIYQSSEQRREVTVDVPA
ncbi:MAG: Gfo/Idh/MocA family oxidoreductase [Planctomycetes bacterium]|nr:Gfo/Idh/MocA family oxidoreductase [Planctomycetota bacterium]